MTFYQQESACLFFSSFTLNYPVRLRKGKRVLEAFACSIMDERTAENGRKILGNFSEPQQK